MTVPTNDFKSGYRNRILPLPVEHRQPPAYNPTDEEASSSSYVREPVLNYLGPFGRRKPWNTTQYLVAYYIAETLPPDLEEKAQKMSASTATPTNPRPYQPPEVFSSTLTLKQRMAQEPEGYEPVHHTRTGVDADELTYESHLLPIEDACGLVKGKIHEHVIRTGWSLIQQRMQEESNTLSNRDVTT